MKYFSGLVLILISIASSAQIYVGEVNTPKGYQYMKLESRNDSTFLSFPYEFRQNFGFRMKAEKGANFTVEARADKRRFQIIRTESDLIEIQTNFTGFEQNVLLRKQREPISKTNLAYYVGNYVDDNGNIVVTYQRRGYLHLMSPYTEQTVSLKPIGKHLFWSTSGETTTFTEEAKNVFQAISLTNRNGETIKLKKAFDYKVKSEWVMVDGDSIYVNLFVPDTPGKKPACLMLPGGGGRPQMDNIVYESRFFAAHGMVVLTFDKSSVGKSKGKSFEHYSFEQKAKRYQVLFNYLKSNSEVDPKKVGIHGPSEGGRLALMMGINLGDEVAFVNATAAPIMTAIEGQLYAADHYSRNLGMKEEDIVSTLMIWKNYYASIVGGQMDTTYFETIRSLNSKYNRAFLPPPVPVIPMSPKKEDLEDQSVVLDANKLVSPVFLQYGENDQRVNPNRSLQNFYGHISKDLDVIAEIYPRGNHSMMTPEYQICSGYAYDKVKWLRSINIIK